jgi:hypothetical protein
MEFTKMADDIPQYEFSAAEERLQRAAQRKANLDAYAASPTGQAQAAKRAAAQTAFGAYETLARELKRPGVSLMVLWQEYRQIAGKPVLLRCGSRAARNPALCYVQFGARTTAVKPHFDSLFDSGLVLHSGELPTSFLGRCHLLRI